MTHAELLRSHASAALREGGMYYSGEYLSRIAATAESLESENARLREMAEKAWKAAEMLCQAWNGPCHADGASIKPPCPLDERDELCVYGQIQRDLRELRIEVD